MRFYNVNFSKCRYLRFRCAAKLLIKIANFLASVLSSKLWFSSPSFCFAGFADCFVTSLFTFLSVILFRSSHQRYSLKKGVFRNFVKFTGKHLSQSLIFNKVAGLRPAILLKKRLWRRYFPVNFVKFLRTTFCQNTSGSCFYLHTASNLSHRHNKQK